MIETECCGYFLVDVSTNEKRGSVSAVASKQDMLKKRESVLPDAQETQTEYTICERKEHIIPVRVKYINELIY
jgi:hypothetical protein